MKYTTYAACAGVLLWAAVALLTILNVSYAGESVLDKVSGEGQYGNRFQINKTTMPDGTICYVATESGHGIALQCKFK